MDRQIKFSFDKVTLTKILKGAMIAATGGAALAILNYLGALEVDNPLLASFLVWLTPVATNVVKEWMKGDNI